MNEGEIWQFVKKPWDSDELKSLLTTAVHLARTSSEAVFTPTDDVPSDGTVLLISHDAAISQVLANSLDAGTRLVHATTLAEAVSLLADARVGTIVLEAMVGMTDVSRFLTLVKHKHPEIVSVVVSDGTDEAQLIRLINHGQLYRIVKRPINTNHLQFYTRNALAKHHRLAADPLLRLRYVAPAVDANLEQGLLQELGLQGEVGLALRAGQAVRGDAAREPGVMRKLRLGFAKLFGRG